MVLQDKQDIKNYKKKKKEEEKLPVLTCLAQVANSEKVSHKE